MPVKIRLSRTGGKKKAFYRVVVADGRTPRDGRFVDLIGRYDPRRDPSLVDIDADKAKDWLGKGAQPTEAAVKLLEIAGVLPARPVKEKKPKEKLSKKAAAKAAEAEQEAAAPKEEAKPEAAEAEAKTEAPAVVEAEPNVEESAREEAPEAEAPAEAEPSAEADASESPAETGAPEEAVGDIGDEKADEPQPEDETAEGEKKE